MKNIYIGIDGGATKCRARIEDESEKLLGLGEGGPSNIRLSVKNTWDSINTAINNACIEAHLDLKNPEYKFHLGLGLAGTEVKSAAEEFLTTIHPFSTLILKSDAFAACLGAHGGKDGGMIIIGTGVIGFCINGEKTIQVGGWGFPHDDQGSGAWLGLEAARLTFKAYDKRINWSPLLKAILQKFKNIDEFATWANQANSTKFAELAPLVVKFMEQKDDNAIQLFTKAGEAIDQIFIALEKQLSNNSNLSYSLFGGMAPFVKLFLSKDLITRLVEPEFDAAKGAILLLKK